MQKIVLDTNVLISSIISEGIPANIIKELVLENKVILCISDSVLHEYSNDFTERKYQDVNVVTPRKYWDEHKPE